MNVTKQITVLFFLCISNNCVMSSEAYNSLKSLDEIKDYKMLSNEIKFNLDSEVQFYLYTRENSDTPQQLWVNNSESIMKSSYNHSQPTAFMVHGWKSNYTKGYNGLVRQAYLDHDDYNVIIIDWSNIAKLSYPICIAQVYQVGNHIAKLIDFLTNHGTNPDKITLVGYSLGAHVVGAAGRNATNKIGHIVGLDPAGPIFKFESLAKSVSRDDAKFVEILHTNIDMYGLARPTGHVDFYANGGGPVQPGCENDPLDCSHDRAYLLFVEAFTRSEQLVARKCSDNVAFLAGQCDKNSVASLPNWSTEKKEYGLYFLRTNSSPPFGIGLKGTKPLVSTASDS